MQQNFLEYASYVVVDRAIPNLNDGCKPVQRRILNTLFEVDDGKFNKVANIIGETMKLHPHGDASIGAALVVLANKEYFIERQGNFGNPITGHAAAAPRYIECRLTELAKETLFNKNLTEYQPSYDGRKKEPIILPVKLPVILMMGTEGIAVGMATRILPHNFKELLKAQIKILEDKRFKLYPDFLQGGIMDVSEYQDGLGKIKVRAKLEPVGDKKILIREVPFSTTTEGLIASIEAAAQKNKVKISSISDFTTEAVEIELTLSRGVYAEEVIPQLYAYTDCEVSISSNVLVIKDRHPQVMKVANVLRELTEQLKETLRAELKFELEQLENRQHWLTLEQIFIEKRIYKRIEKAKTEESVLSEVYEGMKPFKKRFVRELTDEDVKRLLELRIRRISAYDIAKNRKDLDEILAAIKKVKARLRSMVKTTITYLEGLLEKYGKLYPRRTKVETFEAVDKKAVARQNIKLTYDKKSGFFGSAVRSGDRSLTVSEYDMVLAISNDGTFRVLTPQDKVLLPKKVLYLEVFDPEQGIEFTVIYRDTKKMAYAKKIHIHKFIRNKEYRLIKDKAGKVDMLLEGHVDATLKLDFVPAPRQKVKKLAFDLSELEVTSVAARGVRLAPKPVAKVTLAKK
jgi:topoisomerase-4 subunit A